MYPAQSRLRKAQGRKNGLGASRVGMMEPTKSRLNSVSVRSLALSPYTSLRKSGKAR